MAGKNSRSSKTAHVLNLLSGGTPEVKPDAVPPSREAPVSYTHQTLPTTPYV